MQEESTTSSQLSFTRVNKLSKSAAFFELSAQQTLQDLSRGIISYILKKSSERDNKKRPNKAILLRSVMGERGLALAGR
jgi:hypothetical protein